MHVWEGDPFHSQNFAHSECAKTTYCSLRIGTKPNATPGVLPNFLMMPNLHWHYLQDEWHLLKERDLASFDTIGFATPPDSNPIDPPPRSYWGEFFASIHDPPPIILPWEMIILRRNVWSWRDTGSTELSVILGGNKLNLICKFKLETSGRSEGSTIRSAKSQQKGRLHFTLQKKPKLLYTTYLQSVSK